MGKDIIILFGNRVRERRNELGYTQQTLAKLSGLNRSYIGEIEIGKRNITLKSANKIAKALRIEIVDLLK